MFFVIMIIIFCSESAFGRLAWRAITNTKKCSKERRGKEPFLYQTQLLFSLLLSMSTLTTSVSQSWENRVIEISYYEYYVCTYSQILIYKLRRTIKKIGLIKIVNFLIQKKIKRREDVYLIIQYTVFFRSFINYYHIQSTKSNNQFSSLSACI